MAHENPWNAGNPRVYTLIEYLQGHYSDIVFGWGREPFWSDIIFSYDAVHFQWPQAFFANLPAEIAVREVNNRIKQLKQRGIKVFATCHDLTPHYSELAEYKGCISAVYENSDVIFHCGGGSLQLFEKEYPLAQNVLLPLHTFDTIYKYIPNREESLRHLALDPSKKYILCFGSIRDNSERKLIIDLIKHLHNKDFVFIAPSFMRIRGVRGWKRFIPTSSKIKAFYYTHKYNIIMTGKSWVPVSDESLPYYYGVAEMAFIQRIKILNSGNAVMPLLFDKVVVGPAVGNVKYYLEEKGYPTFNPYDIESVVNAFYRGLQLAKTTYAGTVRERYLPMLCTEAISKILYKYYKDFIPQ